MVWVLLDSGSDGDLIFVNKDKPMLILYSNFFEYSDSKRFHVEPNVVEYGKDSKPQYDLILGTETMKELGIILNFRDKMIAIDEIILSMRNINNLQGSSILRALRHNHSLSMEPQRTQDATQRATWILDAKYSKADLQSVVKDNCKHQSADQQKKLLQLLKKYESLFNGTLGDWKTKLVSFQLNGGDSPYHGRAFPVPKIHEEMLINEVERLVKLGVLEQQPALEWAGPLFIIPKKNKIVRFLSNF
jgi:hypothetical protein